jgi:hypothetical protein
MNRTRFSRIAALLLCSSLTLNLVACSSGSPTGQEQTAKPTANAGQSRDVKVGQEVKLDGSASKGASASDTLTYDWAFTSIPTNSKSTLKGIDSVNPTFTPDVPGAYAVTLIVSSGGVTSDPSKVTLTATKDNAKPTAVATASPTSPKTGDVVTLDGSTSSDADGDKLTYKWALASEPSGSVAKLSDATIAKPTFTADKAGDYKFTLVVNDGQIDSDPAPITVSVSDPVHAKPTATATVSKDSVAPGDSIDLDGSASKAALPGATLTYLWSVKSEPTGSTVAISAADKVKAKLTLKLDVAGIYEFALVVNDGKLDSDPAVAKVTVVAPAAKPTASIAAVTGAKVNVASTLDGSGSKPAKSGDALTYAWTVTSGQANATLTDATKAQAKFTATKAGTYKVQLIVTEGTVQSDPVSATITVN